MNPAFRDYVFGTAFTLHLRESQCRALAELCKDGAHGYVFDGRQAGALLTRGLIEQVVEEAREPSDKWSFRYRPTRAGLLVYDLLVEAGDQQMLSAQRRKVIEQEEREQREEWERRFGRIEIRIKDKTEEQSA